MAIKTLLKRKSFTLIEVLISFALLALIVSEGMYLLSRQIKLQTKFKQTLNGFFTKNKITSDIKSLFLHIYPDEKKCLMVNQEGVSFYIDAGIFEDPDISGLQFAKLILKNKVLIQKIEPKEKEPIYRPLVYDVLSVSYKFYSSDMNWQDTWDSTKMGLPEMMHLSLSTSKYKIEKTFLLPFNLKPISLSCKSSPSSFL
jgi:hypothetical protein